MQYVVSSFIYDAEFFTAFDTGEEIVWLWKFISEFGMASSVDSPVLLIDSSTGAIAQVKESIFHLKTKHFLHHYHLIR